MAKTNPSSHIVADPIYAIMDFSSLSKHKKKIKQIVDSSEFQRLRRISQLGMASFVFPGATHTRFSHSLGAAYLSLKVMDKLSAWDDQKEILKTINDNKLVIFLTALLHDIGHGPFSHSFESATNESIGSNKNLHISHEDWSCKIIESFNETILTKKERIDIRDVLKKETNVSPFIYQIRAP